MLTDDFSTPRRMSVSAFVINLVKVFRQLFIPLLITFMIPYFNHNGKGLTDEKLLIYLAIFVAASVLIAFFQYYFRTYYIADGNLIIKSDFLSKRSTSIPLSRIHTLRTNSGFIYRILSVRGVTVDTLASKEEEVELILDESDWQKLLKRIEVQEVPAAEVTDEIVPELPEEVTTMRPDNVSLIKDALCQNHLKGFVVLAGMLGVVINNLGDIDEATLETAVDYVGVQAEGIFSSVATIAIICLVAYIVIALMWVGRILLRYGNMSVKVDDSRLTVERGLISRYTSRFARGKVNALVVKQNPLEKAAGLDTVKMKQAENVGEEKETGDISFYGAGITDDLLRWWLSDNYYNQDEIASARSGRGVMWRVIAVNALIAAGIFFALWELEFPGWAAGLSTAYLLIPIIRGYMAMTHSQIRLLAGYAVVGSGYIASIKSYLRYSDIEEVALRQTPLTRFSRRVSLVIATKGERYVVRSLRKSEAERILNLLLIPSAF